MSSVKGKKQINIIQDSRYKTRPSILPKTRLTAPEQPSHDMPTLRTTVCMQTKGCQYKKKQSISKQIQSNIQKTMYSKVEHNIINSLLQSTQALAQSAMTT